MMAELHEGGLIGICRAHGHWFPVDKVHEPCPEPGCEAACDYYGLLPDSELKMLTELREALEIAEKALRHIQPYIGLLRQYQPEAPQKVALAREAANRAL